MAQVTIEMLRFAQHDNVTRTQDGALANNAFALLQHDMIRRLVRHKIG